MPVALSRKLKPRGMDGFVGVTDMEDRVAEVTVSVVLPDVFSKVAVMVVVPGFKPMATPLPFTVATEVFDDVQVT